jgi:flagellar assembly factor FliW
MPSIATLSQSKSTMSHRFLLVSPFLVRHRVDARLNPKKGKKIAE